MKNPIEGAQPKRELSLKEKKIAVSLESLSSLEIRDKIFLILIWRKLKTASAISVDFTAGEKVMRDMQEKIEKAGLLFKNAKRFIEKDTLGLRAGKICFVADSKDRLKSLSHIYENWLNGNELDNLDFQKEIGLLSGFPQTAIDAYQKLESLPEAERNNVEKRPVFSEEEKRELLKLEPDLIPFSFLFYMSKENWKSELETVRRWAAEIKLASPVLYQQFIFHFNKSSSGS